MVTNINIDHGMIIEHPLVPKKEIIQTTPQSGLAMGFTSLLLWLQAPKPPFHGDLPPLLRPPVLAVVESERNKATRATKRVYLELKCQYSVRSILYIKRLFGSSIRSQSARPTVREWAARIGGAKERNIKVGIIACC